MTRAFAAIVLLLAPLLVFGDSAMPSTIGYYDQAQFQHYAEELAPSGVQILTDSFANGEISIPGVSVSSDIDFDGVNKSAGNGHFVFGGYEDFTEKYSVAVWTFSQPVYAFGGMWNLSSINAGLQISSGGGLYFMPDGIMPVTNTGQAWPGAQWSGFWGFISAVPVESVEISFGDDGVPGNFGQSYRFSDMEVASDVPEPANLGLWGLGILLIRLAPPIGRRLFETRQAQSRFVAAGFTLMKS